MENKLPDIVRKYLEENPEISQTKLAQMAGINPSTISYMLRGEPRRIDLDTVEALHRIIGFDIDAVIKVIYSEDNTEEDE